MTMTHGTSPLDKEIRTIQVLNHNLTGQIRSKGEFNKGMGNRKPSSIDVARIAFANQDQSKQHRNSLKSKMGLSGRFFRNARPTE